MTICAQCGHENPETNKFCGECAAPLAPEGESPREVRKTVTAVFCDVAGSTALGERADAEVVRAVLAGYYDAMRVVIERHGGTVEKFIGDAVMAVFGVPDLHEDDALRAVRAAVEMRAELERLAIPARIGVNTGEVVAGGESLVTGDAVNVAARLEQAAPVGEVLIGDATLLLVRDAVEVEAVEPVAAKGKSESVVAWRLLSVDTTAAGFARRMDAPLMGRQSELVLLAEAYQRGLRERRCHLFTVLGVAGVGKSRLISEFLQGPAGDATVLIGHCVSYGEGITFLPLAEIVRAASGIGEDDGASAARRKLDALVARTDALEADGVAERVAWAIGLAAPVADADEIAWAARKLFESLATEKQMLVLVFEDIHWAEPTLLDLIDNVADLSRGASMLVVCTARPELLEDRPSWAGGKTNATSILLEPLSDESAQRLIDNRPEASGLSAEQRNQIVAAAEGNPLFVEQMLATLGHGSDSREFVVPSTIQALLAARLDSLGVDERRVLESASVEGRVFHRSAVAELADDRSSSELTRLLQGLIRRELIGPDRAQFGGDEAFRFQHQLIRDAAYAHMPKRDRAGMHERFAEWLERRVGERAAEYEEIVGYHLEQSCLLQRELDARAGIAGSEVAARASRLLASAGRRALDRGDTPSAVGLLTRASRLLPSPTNERCQLLLDLYRACSFNLEETEALAVAREALELASDIGDPVLLARADIARLYAETGAFAHGADPAVEADALIERLTELDDDWGLALAWELRLGIAQSSMHGEIAIVAAEHAVVYARRTNQRSLELEMLFDAAGQGLWGPTPIAEAIARCERAIDAAAGDPRRRSRGISIIAALEAMRGNLAEASALRAQLETIDSDLGSRLDHIAAARLWSMVDTLSGDHAAAEVILRASIAGVDPDSLVVTVSRDMIALAILAQGRFDEADELARLSEQSTNLPSEAYGAFWRQIRSRVHSHHGHHDAAIQLAREASTLMATTDYLHDRADTELDLAIVLRAAGHHDQAARAATLAIQLWERKGNTISPPRARAEFGLH